MTGSWASFPCLTPPSMEGPGREDENHEIVSGENLDWLFSALGSFSKMRVSRRPSLKEARHRPAVFAVSPGTVEQLSETLLGRGVWEMRHGVRLTPAKARSFGLVQKVTEVMKGFERPWFVAGGWAIDLFLDRVTRPHKDIDLAILRRDQLTLQQHFGGWKLSKAIPGRPGQLEPWNPGEWLDSPLHEVHASRDEGPLMTLEVLLNESSNDLWLFRRDRRITLPLAELGRLSQLGLPILRPEVVLLYKAKNPKGIDEEDFRRSSRLISKKGRRWLRGALADCHSGHHWITQLG